MYPKLRFKGFDDAWEQRKLGDLAEIVGGGTPSTSKDEYWDGEIDWYAPAEIANQIYVESSERKITSEGLNNSSAKMLPVGTVLFTSRAGIGKMAILRKEACTNQGFQSIVPHVNELDSYFIFSRSEELKRYGETVGAGSTFVEVSGKQMSAMPLMMPPTIDEQRKIGEYFSSLDNLITLHQRQCEALKKQKQFFLQNMFPKEGESEPRIRFNGFTEPWEQRKLFDIADFKSGQGLSLSDISKEGTQECILYGNLYTDYGMIITSVLKSTNAIPSNPVYSKNGDVLVPASDTTPTGLARASCLEKSGVLLGGDINIIRPRQGINGSCLSLAINHNKRQLIRLIKGTTVKHIHNSDLSTVVVALPKNLDEQREIVNTFKNLDNLITLHQRQYEQLVSLKKYLLSKMFI